MATKVKKYKTVSELLNDMPNKTISLSQLKGERIISLSEKKYVTYTLPAREKDKLYQVFAKALKIKKDVIKKHLTEVFMIITVLMEKRWWFIITPKCTTI